MLETCNCSLVCSWQRRNAGWMFEAPGEWTPGTREGWRNTWISFQTCFHIWFPHLNLELVIAGLSSGHDVCESNSIKFLPINQQDYISEKNLVQWESCGLDSFLTVMQPCLIFFTALQNPPYPWSAPGEWLLRCHSPSTKSTLLFWIWCFYIVTDG